MHWLNLTTSGCVVAHWGVWLHNKINCPFDWKICLWGLLWIFNWQLQRHYGRLWPARLCWLGLVRSHLLCWQQLAWQENYPQVFNEYSQSIYLNPGQNSPNTILSLLFATAQVWKRSLYSNGLCQRTTFGDTRWWPSSLWGWGSHHHFPRQFVRYLAVTKNCLHRLGSFWLLSMRIVWQWQWTTHSAGAIQCNGHIITKTNKLKMIFRWQSSATRFTVPQGEVRWQPESPKWES